MGRRIRGFLLMCLMCMSIWAALGAYATIRPPWSSALPEELYRSMQQELPNAQYLLRGRGGFVAVYPNRLGAEPERITSIELSSLRAADQALLARGIPAVDRRSLLELLEDLGS